MDSLSLLEKKELIARIQLLTEENILLKKQLEQEKKHPAGDDFKTKYALEIFNSLPDMLTVLSTSGEMVALVSSEETNHVGLHSSEIEGKHISTFLDEDASKNVLENISRAAQIKKSSVSHHSITVEGKVHHYENRISPLEGEYLLCMCRDVTEEVNAKKDLEFSNLKMEMAEKIANAGHYYFYPDSKELEMPSIFPFLFGSIEPNQRCSLDTYLSFVVEEDRDQLRNHLFGKVSSDICIEHRLKIEGKLCYLHTRAICHFQNENEKVIEGYVQDMTYMIERMQELEHIKYAVNNSSDMIFSVNQSGSIVFANTQLIKTYGLQYPLAGYRAYNTISLGFNTAQEWYNKIDEIRANGGILNYTIQREKPDKTISAYDVMAYIVNDHTERFEAWFFLRDVSERVEQGKRVRYLNQIMDAILNNIPVYLFVKDPTQDFRYIYWNKTFEQYSGISAGKALGHTDFEIFPNIEDANKFRDDDLKLLHSGDRLEFLEDYVAVNGDRQVVKTVKTLIPIEKRMPLIIGISWDITDMQSTEQELIKAKMKAEQSDRLKSAFLANMSHEIRTPLNAIVGFSKLISSVEDPEEKAQYTDIIDTNADLLLQLINDILDLSKIEAGTLEFIEKPMDLAELCRNIYEVTRSKVKPGVTLVLDERYKKVGILGDQNRISQVIINLLNNAIKFTSTGEIRFGFEIVENQIRFTVQDTGKGIPKEKLGNIFDRFVKLDKFAQGSGLGLAITQTIIEKLGGNIGVQSEEGSGATFTFHIPYIPNGEVVEIKLKKPIIKKPTGLQRKLILIVEDNPSNYLLMRAYVGSIYQHIWAKNGHEAIEMYEQNKVDLILMDIKMPVMDGIDATKIIRRMNAEVPIIALTAYAFETDRANALEAGCNDFLTKPIVLSDLQQILSSYLD